MHKLNVCLQNPRKREKKRYSPTVPLFLSRLSALLLYLSCFFAQRAFIVRISRLSLIFFEVVWFFLS